MNIYKDNPSKRVSQIQEQLKIPAKTFEMWVKQLRDEGEVRYCGSKKAGGYHVK